MASQSVECPDGNLVDSKDWHFDMDGQLLHVEAIGYSWLDWHLAAESGEVFLSAVIRDLERSVIRIPSGEGGPIPSDGVLQTGEWESVFPLEPIGRSVFFTVNHDSLIAIEPELKPVEVCRDAEGNVYWRVEKPETVSPSGSKER